MPQLDQCAVQTFRSRYQDFGAAGEHVILATPTDKPRVEPFNGFPQVTGHDPGAALGDPARWADPPEPAVGDLAGPEPHFRRLPGQSDETVPRVEIGRASCRERGSVAGGSAGVA